MTAVVAETDQGKAAKEPPAKPGKEETGNATTGKPPLEVMWAWEQGLPRPEQLPGTNSQLLTPSLANAFGIQMMNGYRFPLPPPSQESGERANGESRAAQGSYHDPMGAAQMQASMPPPYANFHHSMPPPGSANAQAAAAAAMASAAMASPYGFPGMYQAPFGAQRPGGHYDPYGRSLGQGGDRGMGPSQGHLDPNVSYEHMMAYQAGMEHSRSFEAFKRSREEPGMSMGLEGSEDDQAHALKRPRLVWTPPLHKRFVDAVSHLGIKNAVPKTIMQLMNVEGLTRENVASHLQKYRLYLKRLQGCSESTMENSPSREGGGSGGGSGEGSGGDVAGGGARRGGGSGGDGSGNEYKREGSGSEGNDGPGSGQGSGGGGSGANGGSGGSGGHGHHDGGGSGGSDDGSGKGNPAAQSEKGSGAGNASGGSGNGSGNGSDGGGQTQTLKTQTNKDGPKDGPQSQKTEPGAPPAAPAATAQADKATPQGNSGGEGGASGGEGNGSDDGEERPNSMERASSGDGSNDGAAEANEQGGRIGKLASAHRDAPATSQPQPAKEDTKTKRTGRSTK